MKIARSPFLFIGLIILIASGVGAVYYLFIDTEGFNPIAGGYYLLFFFIVGIVLLLEQTIIRRLSIKTRTFWSAETLLLALAVIFLVYGQREIAYRIAETTDWFAVIEDSSLAQNKKKRSFPFDEYFVIPENGIFIVNPEEIPNPHSIKVTGSSKWSNGYQMSRRSVTINSRDTYVSFYFPHTDDASMPEIQGIIEKIESEIE